MGLLFIVIAALVIAVLFTGRVFNGTESDLLNHPYFNKKPLTPTETTFYEHLITALPEYVVLAQVQLSSFIGVDRTKAKANFYVWFNPISQQSVDYLICRRDFSVVAVIELDDKTHNSADAIKRDIKKNKNIAQAGVRMIRWHAEMMPTNELIRKTLIEDADTAKQINQLELNDADAYLRRIRPNPFPAAILGIVLIIGALWALNNVFTSFGEKKFVPNFQATSQSTLQNIVQQQKRKADELTAKQAAEKQLAEQRKYDAHLAQLEQQRAQVEAQQNEINVERLKEDLWNQYYKKSPGCIDQTNVACANEYIKAKAKFEQQWDSGSRDIHQFVR